VVTLWLRAGKTWSSVVYVLLFVLVFNFFLKILVGLVPVFSFPFYQPVFGIGLRLVRDLGGRGLRAGGEEVLHCEFAWVSSGVGVRVWALLVITDPITLGSPVVFGFFFVEEFPFSWVSPKISHSVGVAIGERIGNILNLVLDSSFKS
jgi:hypothetical protein